MANSDLLNFKLLLLGDSGVGKSCIISRFADDEFNASFIPTIGTDFKIKTIVVDGKRIKLQIWDTAGQERFRSVTNIYYREAHGIIFVYDVTSNESFEHLKDWIKDAESHTGEEIEKILVGHKLDLVDEEGEERVISCETGSQFASENGMLFIEAAAKTNKNIKEVFHLLVQRILKWHEQQEIDLNHDDHNISIDKGSFLNKLYCC